MALTLLRPQVRNPALSQINAPAKKSAHDDGQRNEGAARSEGHTPSSVVGPPQSPNDRWGWGDIHEHQFANLAYGGAIFPACWEKLIRGRAEPSACGAR